MERCVRHQRGGIRSLLLILRDHEGAVRHDLLKVGLRLDDVGTDALSWVDLWAFCHYARPGTALFDEVHPDYVDPQLQVLGLIELNGRWLLWSKTKDAQHGSNKPEPLPFLKPPREHTPTSIEEMSEFLGWKKAG